MNNWENYKPSPIEVFHSEAVDDFHAGAEYEVNQVISKGIKYINGVEFNRILVRFKKKIMKEYGITGDPIKKKE